MHPQNGRLASQKAVSANRLISLQKKHIRSNILSFTNFFFKIAINLWIDFITFLHAGGHSVQKCGLTNCTLRHQLL